DRRELSDADVREDAVFQLVQGGPGDPGPPGELGLRERLGLPRPPDHRTEGCEIHSEGDVQYIGHHSPRASLDQSPAVDSEQQGGGMISRLLTPRYPPAEPSRAI